jgi:MYXO-CTERM domain-containing protein
VRIESPGDGAVFDVGATFEIAVIADDDEELARVELRDGDRMFGADTAAPWGWQVKSASEGEYRFVVAAIDAAGNEAFSQEIVVAVAIGGDAGLPDTDGDVEPDPADDDGDGSSDDGREASLDGDESGSDDVGEHDSAAKDVRYHAFDDASCACRSGPDRTLPLPLLVLLFAARRRRAR